MSKILSILSNEHENILIVIDFILKKAENLDTEGINEKIWNSIIDFIRNYADKFHHAKEEDILFKEFCKSENLHCNPVEQMLYEHDLGRDFVKGMVDGVKENNKEKIKTNARGYAALLKEHIFKEDNILYPMAEKVLNEKSKNIIIKKFEEIEIKKKAEREKYLSFVNQIKNELK